MLCENDLVCKIAEYRCRETLTESDCVKLAAFLTIRDCLFHADEGYQEQSFAAPPEPTADRVVEFGSDSEFFEAANGLPIDSIWEIIDELMETLQVINPRLYAGVIRKLQE